MSTRTFRKPLLAIAALCTTGILVICMVYSLDALSDRAERDLGAYPFKAEDWLRYLIPARFIEQGAERILLTGPSTVRENLLYERFEEEFPGHDIVQGGISLGTIDDVTASLHYISRAYGEDALPEIIVLGISPRFIANIPEDRPFEGGIDRYSPCFSTIRNHAAIELVPKNTLESLIARARFLIHKQPDRFRTAIFATFNHLIAGDPASPRDRNVKTPAQQALDRFFKRPLIRRLVAKTRFGRTHDHDFTEVLAWLMSPYKYRLDPPITDISGLINWMDGEDSWWREVHAWNPRNTAQATRASLERFNAVVTAHDIDLLVVNMPERDASRLRYDRENYAAYLDIVRETLGDPHFMDLQSFLHTGEFHDLEHSVYQGSLRLTDEIISSLREIVS